MYAIQEAIKRARTMDEVDRLHQLLSSGQFAGFAVQWQQQLRLQQQQNQQQRQQEQQQQLLQQQQSQPEQQAEEAQPVEENQPRYGRVSMSRVMAGHLYHQVSQIANSAEEALLTAFP
ncbi:unnamed protein product [Echinostoma caproni]|uniref:Uncharacterized protein n=1 Tax=Echinostoma caproni TaxID=27848 RepID=A0A3P8LG14_9TREM|nr:unnamed protein product [Echinostoma caproni]